MEIVWRYSYLWKRPTPFFFILGIPSDQKPKISWDCQGSLDFLIEQTYDRSKDYFSFVGNKGWYQKGKKPAVFYQEPVEAGNIVEVYVKAYEVLKDTKYLHFAKTAFLW